MGSRGERGVILVSGGAGYVGSAVCRRLWERGERNIAACVRNHAKALQQLPSGFVLRAADYEGRGGLVKAFRGVTRLFIVPSDGFASTILRHLENLIDAAGEAGVDHVVLPSIVDVADDSPFYYAPVYREAERRLRESGMRWTILRSGLYADFVRDAWLHEALTSGILSLPAGDARIAPISRMDIAQAGASVLSDADRHIGQTYHLVGAKALSFADIAHAMGEAFAQPVEYRPIEPSAYLLKLVGGMEDPWPQAYSTLLMSIAEGRFSEAGSDFERLTGVPPEPFEPFLRRGSPESGVTLAIELPETPGDDQG